MDIPKKAKRKIGFGLGVLEVGSVFAGSVVVLGIWIESKASIVWAWKHGVWPAEATGGLLVGVGVFAEVVITAVAARRARRSEIHSEDRIAQAERATAEANLARVQMEGRLMRLTINRHLTNEEIESLQEKIKRFAGQPFVVTFAPTNDAATMEPLFFSSQLREVLEGAGWVWAGDNIPLTERVGRGVLIECNEGHQLAAFGLQGALSTLGFAVKASWIENEKLPQIWVHVGLV